MTTTPPGSVSTREMLAIAARFRDGYLGQDRGEIVGDVGRLLSEVDRMVLVIGEMSDELARFRDVEADERLEDDDDALL